MGDHFIQTHGNKAKINGKHPINVYLTKNTYIFKHGFAFRTWLAAPAPNKLFCAPVSY